MPAAATSERFYWSSSTCTIKQARLNRTVLLHISIAHIINFMKTMLDALDLNSMANEFVWWMPSLHGACMRLESPLCWYIATYIYINIVHADFA